MVKRILDNLVQYGDIILALIASLIAMIFSLRDEGSLHYIISMISVTLGVFAIITLRDRRKADEILSQLKQSQQSQDEILQQVHRSRFLSLGLPENTNFGHEVSDICGGARKEIYIIVRFGNSLRIQPTFKNALDRGCHIHLLLCSNKNQALMEMLAFGRAKTNTVEDVKRELENTLADFKDITLKYLSKGSLEVRMIDYIPSMSLILIDPDEITGQLSAIWMPFMESHNLAPRLRFRKSDDEAMFNYFHKQLKSYFLLSEKVI